MVTQRLHAFRVILAVGFALVVCGLANFQLLHGRVYRERSQRNSIRLMPFVGPRGTIMDRNGELLAVDRLALNIALVGQELESLDEACRSLAALTGRDPATLKAAYKRNYLAPFAPTPVVDDVPQELALAAAELGMAVPGITVQSMPKRVYPLGEATAHCIGYVREIDPPLLSRWQQYGYRMKDTVGRKGLEAGLDAYLHGEDGGQQLLVDHRARMVRPLGARQAKPGRSVRLTIDGRLQQFLSEQLKNYAGAAVVMDVNDGAVWALVSSPSFPPDRPEVALKGENSPMLNRAVQGTYPPGSIFKLVTALAGLSSGAVTRETSFVCSGATSVGPQQFRCWFDQGHGDANVHRAIVGSCNVYFIRTGIMTGPEAVSRLAREFGFGRVTEIGLPEERAGLVPDPSWKRSSKGEGWYQGDTANFSIGQGFLQVTPLQAAQMTAAVANGGKLLRPRLVEQIDRVAAADVSWRRLPVSSEALDIVRNAMIGVVYERQGTGQRARKAAVRLAGKTGTAQTGRGESHAWFVGFFPVKEPRFAFAVMLEHGGHGGDAPALIVRNMVDAMHEWGVAGDAGKRPAALQDVEPPGETIAAVEQERDEE